MYCSLQRRQDVNYTFRVPVDTVMDGSHFPSGRKGIICAAVGDIAASDEIFAASKGSLVGADLKYW